MPLDSAGTAILPLRSLDSRVSVDGREVLDLRPGDNDIRALSPRVYFLAPVLHDPPSQTEVRKIIVAE